MTRRKLCPHCTREVSKNALFCPYCGFDLAKTICEGCLKRVDISLDNCPYCGNPLRKEVIVPSRIENMSDERYKIVEVKDDYTVLKENDITLEKYKPISLEDFFYTTIGIFYDVIYLDEEHKLPVLLPTHPITPLTNHWDLLSEDEKVKLIFNISNTFLKNHKLFISKSPILFDKDGKLIVNVSETNREGFLSAIDWLKEFILSLHVSDGSLFKNIILSNEFDKIHTINELVNFLYASFSSFSKSSVESFGITSQGIVRSHNEDNYVIIEYSKHGFNGVAPYNLNIGLYILSDGMGGHRQGEEASRLIVKIASEEIISYLTKEHVFFDLIPVINRAIQRANAVVYEKNKGSTSEREKMGATIAGVILVEDDLWYFNLGDSSIMLFDGKSLLKVSIDDVTLSNKKALTQAVGVMSFDKLMPHISKYSIENEIKFLICSDGLTDLVKFAEIEDALREHSVEDAAKTLLSIALERGGTDNITIIAGKIRRNKLF